MMHKAPRVHAGMNVYKETQDTHSTAAHMNTIVLSMPNANPHALAYGINSAHMQTPTWYAHAHLWNVAMLPGYMQ